VTPAEIRLKMAQNQEKQAELAREERKKMTTLRKLRTIKGQKRVNGRGTGTHAKF
jgi:hypothetical protein